MVTGKSLSEALIFAEMGRTCCVYKLFWMSKQKHKNQFVYTTRSELGIFMYWPCNLMNNLSSYYGLFDARISASDKDFPLFY